MRLNFHEKSWQTCKNFFGKNISAEKFSISMRLRKNEQKCNKKRAQLEVCQ